jgi:hypothetical protein
MSGAEKVDRWRLTVTMSNGRTVSVVLIDRNRAQFQFAATLKASNSANTFAILGDEIGPRFAVRVTDIESIDLAVVY